MYLAIQEIGMLKKDYANDNPLNICSEIKEFEGHFEVKPEDKKIIEVITSPERVCRIVLQENGIVVEKYGYVKNNIHIIAENKDDMFVLDNLKERLDIAVSGFLEFIGMSELKKVSINTVMDSPEELMLLMALIDIYREKNMLELCGKETELSANFSEIREHLDKSLDSSMVSLFKKNFNYKEPVIADTKNMLNKFIEKGILKFDNIYKLTEDYEFLATTFLVPDTIMTAEMLELENREVVNSSMLYISAGVQSNLLFIFGNDGIEISTISSFAMSEIIKNLLNCTKI